MNRIASIGACLAVALGVAACQDQMTAPTPAVAAPAAGTPLHSASAAGGFVVDRGLVRTPPSAHLSDLYFPTSPLAAINPADYVCSASSPVFDAFNATIDEFIEKELDILITLVSYAADQVPTYDAVYLQEETPDEYFGYDGEFTQVLQKTERDIKRFWDIPSDDIQLIGLHGTMLLDTARVAAVYREVYGLPAGTADAFAAIVVQAMKDSELANGGNHPLFSFNAFAASFGFIPDKIIMGDGILDGYADLGFGDVAPKAIFAHEFAHHIQFENDYFRDFETQAEETRYGELMADAMGAYFLTHKRGAAMNRKRVEQFLDVYYQIGDCAFTDGGHHGTPNQRLAAATFGFELAASAQKQGHILTAEQFHAEFLKVYDSLVAPDAP